MLLRFGDCTLFFSKTHPGGHNWIFLEISSLLILSILRACISLIELSPLSLGPTPASTGWTCLPTPRRNSSWRNCCWPSRRRQRSVLSENISPHHPKWRRRQYLPYHDSGVSSIEHNMSTTKVFLIMIYTYVYWWCKIRKDFFTQCWESGYVCPRAG